MVLVRECGIALVAPGFGVEMQAENKIRAQLLVHATCPLANFAGAIKQDLAVPAYRLFLEWIVGPLEFFRRIFRPARLEHRARGFPEIVGTERRDRLRFFAHERNACPEPAQFLGDHPGHLQRHLSFLDGRGVA